MDENEILGSFVLIQKLFIYIWLFCVLEIVKLHNYNEA